MKQLLITIATVALVGCGESQQSATTQEAKHAEQVPKAAKPKPPTAKSPDISIHEAAKEGNFEAVKQHLAAGTDADVNIIGETHLAFERGETLFYGAAMEGHKEVAKQLIANGADVNAKNADGEPPLDYAHQEIADSSANTAARRVKN